MKFNFQAIIHLKITNLTLAPIILQKSKFHIKVANFLTIKAQKSCQIKHQIKHQMSVYYAFIMGIEPLSKLLEMLNCSKLGSLTRFNSGIGPESWLFSRNKVLSLVKLLNFVRSASKIPVGFIWLEKLRGDEA